MAKREDKKTTNRKATHTELDPSRNLVIVQECKKEIISWARSWLSILTILTFFLGLIGTNVLTATVVRSFIDIDIKNAEKATITAEYAAKLAQIKMKKATENAENYTNRIKELNSKASNLEESFLDLENRSKATYAGARQYAMSEIVEIQRQVDDLYEIATSTHFINATVAHADSQRKSNEENYSDPDAHDDWIESRDNTKPYITSQTVKDLIDKQSDIKKETQNIRKKFAENSDYFVSFVLLPRASSGGSRSFTRMIMPLTQTVDNLTLMMEDQIAKEGFLTNIIENINDAVSILKPLLQTVNQNTLENNVVVFSSKSDEAKSNLVCRTLKEKFNIINVEYIPSNFANEKQIYISIPNNENILFNN